MLLETSHWVWLCTPLLLYRSVATVDGAIFDSEKKLTIAFVEVF